MQRVSIKASFPVWSVMFFFTEKKKILHEVNFEIQKNQSYWKKTTTTQNNTDSSTSFLHKVIFSLDLIPSFSRRQHPKSVGDHG